MTLDAPATTPMDSFGKTFYIEPKARHTHTAIMLHGRGSDGEEFADEFFDTRMSDGSTFAEKLPSWKWVFPSSQTLWSTAFEEEMPAWFEAHSLTDITTRQALQISGIQGSVKYLTDIVDQEVTRLQGKADQVIMIGISQGAAIGLWTLFSLNVASTKVGAFIGASAWLPFANKLKHYSCQKTHSQSDSHSTKNRIEVEDFIKELIPTPIHGASPVAASGLMNNTPVFLGHGIDDAYVDVELGRQARDVLASIGFNVEWQEYEGAEQEGHWLKEPEETDDIFQFIQKVVTGPKVT